MVGYGYTIYDEWEGNSVHRLYSYPYYVICEVVGVVTSFKTERKAREFIAQSIVGGFGYVNLRIENWNRLPLTVI